MSSAAEVLFGVGQAKEWVADELALPSISRTAFYNWRQTLGLIEAPYTAEDLDAIAAFGRYVIAGASLSRAREMTINYLKGKSTND